MENNYKLYDYQQEAVVDTIDYLLNKKGNPVIVAPTGARQILYYSWIMSRMY